MMNHDTSNNLDQDWTVRFRRYPYWFSHASVSFISKYILFMVNLGRYSPSLFNIVGCHLSWQVLMTSWKASWSILEDTNGACIYIILVVSTFREEQINKRRHVATTSKLLDHNFVHSKPVQRNRIFLSQTPKLLSAVWRSRALARFRENTESEEVATRRHHSEGRRHVRAAGVVWLWS